MPRCVTNRFLRCDVTASRAHGRRRFPTSGLTNTVSAEDRYSGTAVSGTPSVSKSYSFDAFDNRVTMTNTDAGKAPETFTYGYDVHGSVSLLLLQEGGERARTFAYRWKFRRTAVTTPRSSGHYITFEGFRRGGQRVDWQGRGAPERALLPPTHFLGTEQ